MITVRHQSVKKARTVPTGFALTVFIILPALLILAFLVDKLILQREHHLDQLIFDQLGAITNPSMTRLMVVVNFFGSVYFLIPAYSLLILIYTILEKDRVQSRNIAAVGLAGFMVLWALNTVFQHAPPPDPLKLSGFSFPGGHPFLLFTFFGLLIYIAWKQRTSLMFKCVLAIMLLAIVWAIAFSRIYLHVHYFTDVITGLCLCMMWLGISGWLLSKRKNEAVIDYAGAR